MHKILTYFITTILLTATVFSEETFKEKVAEFITKQGSSISEENKKQIQSALTAFGSLKAKEVVYISSPISSGKRLYDYMDACKCSTLEEAKKDWNEFFACVMLPNIEDGEDLSKALAEKSEGVVIAPTSFENKNVKSWRQNEYMSMWISVIDRHVNRLVMIDGWEYSNGSSEEFMWAALMQMGFSSRKNIEIVDARGEILTLDQGLNLLSNALADMQKRGFQAKTIENVITMLLEAKTLSLQ